ncbi:MAG: HIT domain-containing protein [Gemmataceae bacterium]|nr:HIT domain-containing protein [Gemmataceae bacterium]
MDQLWAPWRLAYVAAAKPPADGDPCFICRGVADTRDRDHHIALRTAHSVVVLNRFPYNNGHLLVAPTAHVGNLHDLTAEQILDTQRTLARMLRVVDGLMHPEGYNIGLNLGRAAGAGLPGHVHWHIVPRWNGDTNFMTVLSDVRVIAQALDALYDALVEALQRSVY